MIYSADIEQARSALDALDEALDALDQLIDLARTRGWTERLARLRTLRNRIAADGNDLEGLFT